MARSAESCIFCAPSPCTCNVGKRKLGGRSRDTERQSEHSDRGILHHPISGDSVRSDEASPRPRLTGVNIQDHRVNVLVPQVPIGTGGLTALPNARPPGAPSPDELEFRRALTLLCTSGLVCADDIEKNAADLDLTESEKRLLIWKQKRIENGTRRLDSTG
jgi:hypothetical protein